MEPDHHPILKRLHVQARAGSTVGRRGFVPRDRDVAEELANDGEPRRTLLVAREVHEIAASAAIEQRARRIDPRGRRLEQLQQPSAERLLAAVDLDRDLVADGDARDEDRLAVDPHDPRPAGDELLDHTFCT